MSISNHLICPITHNIMTNPVSVDCGSNHIFEQAAIQFAMDDKQECPLDRRLITYLTPLPDLRTEAHAFITSHPELFENKTPAQLEEELTAHITTLRAEMESGGMNLEEALQRHPQFAPLFQVLLSNVKEMAMDYIAETENKPQMVKQFAKMIAANFFRAAIIGGINATAYYAAFTVAQFGINSVLDETVQFPASLIKAFVGLSMGKPLMFASEKVEVLSRFGSKLQSLKFPIYSAGGTALAYMLAGPVAATATAAMMVLKYVPKRCWIPPRNLFLDFLETATLPPTRFTYQT